MASDPWGVDDGYWDVRGTWHPTPPDTATALHAAMDADADHGEPPGTRRVWVVPAGTAPPLDRPGEIRLEDGTELRAVTGLPPDLPIGYHDLRPLDDGPVTRLIVTPGRCHLPADLRGWVLGVQLYSCRSGGSWGVGDLRDLAQIAAWAAESGAAMVAVNPLHAPLPIGHVEPSPYYPSSRRWRNPLYLRIEEIPGAADPAIDLLAAQGRALNRARLIDRDGVWALKREALERLWDAHGGDLRFERWRTEQGDDLETYARFCALAEHHGTRWLGWPEEHRHPARAAVAEFAAAHADRVAFWCWLQFLLDDQVARAAAVVPLLADLAVGVDPDGADAWAEQDLLALDVRVGAPPDAFNPAGQDWGLPPYVPWKLRDAAYAPLVRLWRSALARGGGLRIDHVMGLFRLFWLPPGAGPDRGAYVRYRGDELLAVLAVESVRGGALVVGEDLGTVEDEVRPALHAAGVLSSRLVWFEPLPPDDYPRQSLAAVTTHDLPTVAGVWTGEDVADQRAAGVGADEAAAAELRRRLVALTPHGDAAPLEEVIVGVHRRLAAAPSALVAMTMEDALAVTLRPNLPGTTDQRPNWALALPVPLEQVFVDPLVQRLTLALRVGRRA